MQLDVLAVRKVRGGARIVARNLSYGAQLGGIGAAAVEAHAHHEVFILQLGIAELGGHLPAQVLVALGVQAQPLETGSEILGGDGRKPLLGIDIDNALAHGEGVVSLLDLLVGVQRGGAINLPLAFRLLRAGWPLRRGGHVCCLSSDSENLPV